MTELLVRKFVKNHEQINKPEVRRSYGTLSSIVGILCNILLFVIKYVMGTISGSIAILSDAFNNLSDAASCIVTLLGYKMAAKPADKDHPFGHGRMEYLTALFIAVLIILVGFELLKNSIDKIINPVDVKFSWIVLASLIISILIKLWMSFFNGRLGKKIDSAVMIATSEDSRTDVIATAVTCVSLICALFTDLPVDGVMGIVVSAFVFKAGVDIVRETVDKLLGGPADPQIVSAIKEIVDETDRIIGIHDLVIHNYGPGNMIGSFHAEVKSTDDFVEVHDIIDALEKRIHNELNIMMTIHMDPIETDNEYVSSLREMTEQMIRRIDETLNIHDFRAVIGDTHTNLIFDVVVPYDCRYDIGYIKECIDNNLSEKETDFYAVVTFDREFA